MDIDDWLRRLSAELDVADVALDDHTRHTVLDLARDAAHEVERAAAPLSTFLVGVAVGRGQTLDGAAAKLTALALAPIDEPIRTDSDPDGDAHQAG
jgi:hypothetical protein